MVFSMFLFLLFFCSFPLFADKVDSKNEQVSKIKKAYVLIQEAMVLLQEVSHAIEDPDSLDVSSFELALVNIRQGQFELARKALVPFSKSTGVKSVQALYWIGVCFVTEKNYEKAMVTFVYFLNKLGEVELNDDFVKMKNSANKYLIYCFEKLQRVQDSCAILKRMKSENFADADYVNANYARLNCSKFDLK